MASQNGKAWNVSMIAWGEPSDPRSFSGYSAYLTKALKRHGHVRREFSAKCVSKLDLLRGAFDFKFKGLIPKPVVSRQWMWSERGQQTLSQRFAARLAASGDRGAFLQVGTLVEVPRELGPHYMLTDMTIPQAEREGQFDVGRLGSAAAKEAVRVQGRVLRTAEHIFVLSEWARQSMLEDFDLDPDRVSVVYAGANLVIPDGVTETRAEREILFVGIDWERKGGPLLVEAFKRVRQKLPDVTLRIVGCTPAIDEPGVTVDGFFDKRDPSQYAKLARLYLRASVFCLPSLFDPFPNVIIEAASIGLPSVAVDNGSRREAVIDGVTGSLAPTATPQAVADALLAVLSNPARAREMGQAARERADEHFTWDRVVEKIAHVMTGDRHPAEAARSVGAR